MSHYLVTVTPRELSAQGERSQALYLLSGPDLSAEVTAKIVAELLHDPVVQEASWFPLSLAALNEPAATSAAHIVELAYRPGVTDNEGETVIEGAHRLGVSGITQARALRRYLLPEGVDPQARAAELTIDLVQTYQIYTPGEAAAERLAFYTHLVDVPTEAIPQIAQVALTQASESELLEISRKGVLALDLEEMRAVQAYFAQLGREPNDGELETIAQTWSEHCSHKTFKAKVSYQQPAATKQVDAALHPMLHFLEQGQAEIDSLIKTFLMVATQRVLAEKGDDWVLSAFVDNAGIVAFTDTHEVSFKVETHNHPSALEPFGGANTGVGGVIRDVLGVSARPIANTDVLCFGLPDANVPRPEGVLDPRRVASGVVAGVRDYGNKLGIPTVNGAVLFNPGYTANPLVYCGTLGIAPRGAHPRNVQPGDHVVVLGGRTGRDGIHGATFSSIELTHSTAEEVGSAVQIGDPITEKKLLDVLLQARDAKLYSAITDCGAGGLSSAVGEMGAETGVSVELATVSRKYAGLQPWEVWLSEAQERMVLAVPPANLDAFLALCAGEDVEAAAIGQFTGDHRLKVSHHGHMLVDMDMAFLHDGRPQRLLSAIWNTAATLTEAPKLEYASSDLLEPLLELLAHPNIASKEQIVRSYDHEIGGATVIKPLVGAQSDGPGNAAVLQPLPQSTLGLALGCGINPTYGQVDPYWMGLAVIDEALRNVVAVGGNPERTTILDNFCWGDPKQPDRMAGLVRASAACYDAALAFGTPFISGKDSLNNEYRDAQGTRVAIPPTLLISALAEVPDVRRAITMDLKESGNLVYLVGATRHELAGSHLGLTTWFGRAVSEFASDLPKVDLVAAKATFGALHQAIQSGLIRACHDLSEGGLAVAAAEMAIAGELGLALQLESIEAAGGELVKLFSESPSRFLVEVRPSEQSAFEAALNGIQHAQIGSVREERELRIQSGGDLLIAAPLAQLKAAWQGGLEPFV